LISSGQACVAFGIATFSRDGDWIIREDERSCSAVLRVLEKHRSMYRLGVPLHPDWLCRGLTSHFEFQSVHGFRIRTDFCSRPPRVSDVDRLWTRAVRAADLDVVDVESLIRLKQTRRLRDYSMIGALAEVAGLGGGIPNLALFHLQDYESLAQAVRRWPAEAAACGREAVRLLVLNAPRSAVVAAIAVEQDARAQEDEARIAAMESEYGAYVRTFSRLRARWRRTGTELAEQHLELMTHARALRRATA
jgi:muconolactone delta-isomerase